MMTGIACSSRIGPQRAADVPSVESRQHHVEQQQVGRALTHPREHARAGEHHRRVEARLPHAVRQQVGDVFVVLDNEQAGSAGVRLAVW